MATITEKEAAFIIELGELLEKYNAFVGFGCGECSDLHGVYGEKIVASLGDGKDFVLSEGYSVSGYEINQKYENLFYDKSH